ncbi:MAG TPA: motility protein A [Anaerolineaceae bacterium]|nr:motility protein A [Anaerolineaceae bacterium]
MDLATIIGLIVGMVTIILVMVLDGGSPAELFAVPQAILLIIAGSLSATTITVPLRIIMRLPVLVMKAVLEVSFDSAAAIETLAAMADKARREGLLALEEESKKIKDPFMLRGIMLVVDGIDPAQVEAILENNIHHMRERHKQCYGLFTAAGGFAPTFGIIGTVMGLISVLKQLDDPTKLAGSIASAFLATLWGLLTANLIYLPLGAKLKSKSEEEIAYRTLLMEGILAIQAGENPRVLKEKLYAYLPPKANEKEGKEKQQKPKAVKADAKAKAEA